MTSTAAMDRLNAQTDENAPPCPSWCTAQPHGWDSLDGDRLLVRGHDGPAFPSVPEGGGYDAVQISTGASETEGHPVEPMTIQVEAGNGVILTAAQARRLAEHLLDAANACDVANAPAATAVHTPLPMTNRRRLRLARVALEDLPAHLRSRLRAHTWDRIPPVARHTRELREEGRRAFQLGRDIERQEIGLPTMNYSGYFGEPTDGDETTR